MILHSLNVVLRLNTAKRKSYKAFLFLKLQPPSLSPKLLNLNLGEGN